MVVQTLSQSMNGKAVKGREKNGSRMWEQDLIWGQIQFKLLVELLLQEFLLPILHWIPLKTQQSILRKFAILKFCNTWTSKISAVKCFLVSVRFLLFLHNNKTHTVSTNQTFGRELQSLHRTARCLSLWLHVWEHSYFKMFAQYRPNNSCIFWNKPLGNSENSVYIRCV